MSASIKTVLLSLLLLGGATSAAIAHPHKNAPKEETEEKKWPYFGKSEDAEGNLSQKLEERFELHFKRMEKSLDKARAKMAAKSKDGRSMDDLRAAAEAMDDLFADGEMFTELADMVTELADDFEMADDADGTKVFLFDGKEMGRFKHESDKRDRMKIGGLGQNLTIERETYVKDGKTKTRIVIEMDGGENVEIDLPALKDKSGED